MKNLIALILILPLSACITLLDEGAKPGLFSPKPLFLRNLPQGEDRYSIGFRDGCYNIMGQTGFGLIRMYDRPINPNKNFITNEQYQQGFRQGDRYCGVYVHKGIIL